MTEGPFEMRHEEGGYVEFLNEEVPTVVREIDGRVAILTTLEKPRKVVGYRVYDPGSSPSEVFGSASPAGVKPKPLEWEPILSPREDGPSEATGDIEANTMIGEYSVCFDEDEAMSDTPWCCWSPVECIGHFADFEAAKSSAFADYSARIMSATEPAGAGVETGPPSTHVPGVLEAADTYVVEQGIEHSGGIIERAFEAGALWSMERAKAVRWRMFEDTTPGYWGIELENAGNDDDAILYPQKIQRDTVVRIVEAHNAALTKEGEHE